jgi:cytochrome c oxidase subunit 1
LLAAAVGGVILWASVLLYFVIILGTLVSSRKAAQPFAMPVAEALRDPSQTPTWLDNWQPWLIVTFLLILLSYGPPLAELLKNVNLSSAGMRAW